VIHLDPELAFVGAVLHLSPITAAEALAVIDDDDLADPRLQLILQAARRLVDEDVAPDGYAVMAVIRRAGTATTAHDVSLIAHLILDAIKACPVPASWRFHAVAVLDEALRRRCRALAARIAQAANGPLDTLTDLVHAETAAVAAVDRRRAALLPAPRLGVAA
jgi:replicative DNA helicase